jgi:hypothetical protein
LATFFLVAFLATLFFAARFLGAAFFAAFLDFFLVAILFLRVGYPGLIRFLGVIPALAVIVNIIAGIWMLVATITAVRQALDYRSTWRAVGVCLVGWIVQILVLAVVFAALGVGVPR